MPTPEEITDELREVFDPEIPVNIIDLGLVYDVQVADKTCNITMSLTSEHCPEAQNIPARMRQRVNAMDGIDETEIEIVWEPAWTPQRISPEGRKILGIDPE